MTLQELKQSLETGSFKPTTMILVSEDKFIPLQYVAAMNEHYAVQYIDSLEELTPSGEDLFLDNTEVGSDIVVFNTDLVDFSDELLFQKDNVVVISTKIDKAAKKFYGDLVIEVPKLADWQVKDMVYSFGVGIDTPKLDWLIKTCGGDVHRLYQEMSKLSIFNEAEKKHLFEEMLEDGAFGDLSSATIFNFVNAVLRKDTEALGQIYAEVDNIDVNDFGLLTLLYNNFLNVISIQLGVNPTQTSLGMSYGQFNAVKRNCGYYSGQQLINIVRMLSDMDRKIKSGEFNTNIMRDYMVMSILAQ